MHSSNMGALHISEIFYVCSLLSQMQLVIDQVVGMVLLIDSDAYHGLCRP